MKEDKKIFAAGKTDFNVKGGKILNRLWNNLICIRFGLLLTLFFTCFILNGQTNFYSYQNGNWNDANTWTLDPSGALYNNPTNLIPTNIDRVEINTGHTVIIPAGLNNQTVSILKVEGTLDLGATTGHTFTNLSGNGRIRISNADIFPATTTNTFFTTDEGTVEYYGNAFNLSTARNIHHLEVNMTAGQTLTLLATPYNIGGNLTIKQGTLSINNNSATTKLRITVQKDITIASGAFFTVGTTNMLDGTQANTGALQYYNVFHTIDCYGNFTNNGTVKFTNQTAPVYNALTTTGAVSLFMKGSADKTFTCNGTTDLYNLIVDKGSDNSYKLTVYASSLNNFRLFGANGLYDYATGGSFTNENPELRKALWIRNGTLELTGYLLIPSLTEGNGDYYIPANGTLWINGANVDVRSTDRTNPGISVGGVQGTGVDASNTGAQSFSIFGNLQVTKGYFSTGSHGIVLWYQPATFGGILVEGGQCDIPGIRTANGNTAGKFSFMQSGGVINFRGNNGNENMEDFASLCIRGTDCSFGMTGGTMNFYDGQTGNNNAGDENGGIIRIESDPSNINVSGGTINIIRNNAGSDNFTIYSTAPFYNLNLTGVAASTLTTSLNTSIEVKNNLTINDYATLDATTADNNVSIGGNFTLGNTATTNNAVYNARANTTTFTGNQNSTITVANTATAAPLVFNHLIIDKTPTSSLATAWQVLLSSPSRNETAGNANNHLVTVNGNMTVNEGKWNNYRYKTRVGGNLTNFGTILGDATNTGRITLESGTARHQLMGSNSVTNSFGYIELNDAQGAELYSNISTGSFYLTAGIMDINTYNLAVTGSILGNTFSSSKMIQSYGSASSQGVTVSFTGLTGAMPSTDYLIPIGVAGVFVGNAAPLGVAGVKYTPLTININGNVGAGTYSGTVNVRAVNEYHATSDPTKTGDLIPFYWKTSSTGNLASASAASISYTFTGSSGFTYTGGKKECYYRNNDWTEVDNASNPLVFSATGFSTTDYTAGKKNAFRAPQYLYSRQSGNWNTLATWSTVSHGVTSAPTVINSFDVYEIGGTGGVNHQVTVTTNNTVASKVFILSKVATGIATDPPPSLIVNSGLTGNDFNLVSGGGRMVLNDGTFPAGDFLDFAYNDTAIFEYTGGSYTIPNNLAIYPNLRISGNSNSIKTGPGTNILVRKDLKIGDNTNTGVILRLGNGANGNITINDSLVLSNQGRLEYQNSGTNRNVTVLKNVNMVTGANFIGMNGAGGTFTNSHQLLVQGNIRVGSSNLALWNSSLQNSIDLVLNGETDSRIYDYSGTISLSRLIVNKASSTLNAIIDESFSINAPANTASKPLSLLQGILRINNSATNLTLTSGVGDFTIPSTASLILDQGSLNVSGNNTGITLDGLLEINGGTISVYNAANSNNYIQYSSSGNARINVNGGLLRIGSQLRRYTTSNGGILNFNQTNGSVEVGYKDAPTANRGVFEILNTGSYFGYTGGNLSILTAPPAASAPALYLDLDAAATNIASSTTFTLGGLSGSPQIGVYSTVALPNVIVSGTGTPTVKMWNIPLTINGNLTINSGGSFNANGLQLNLKGNFTNNGTFTHNNNTTVFNGTSNQTITGATTFYNLTKSTSNTVNVNSNISVSNNLRLESGILADNGSTISVLRNVYNAGIHTYGGIANSSTQLGIHVNGNVIQAVSGSGTFGKLTIDNSNGAYLPVGSSILVNNSLRLNQGIFDIQGNLLALGVNCSIEGSGFGVNKMIQTNVSFTDNGIKKIFPSGAQTFTYPIGSLGKYTPLTFNITANSNSTGSITLKAANEIHPSIMDDTETGCQLNDLNNVLQYHWVLRSSGISGFSGTAEMNGVLTDMKVSNSCGLTPADYLTARILMGSILWNKFTPDKFDEATGVLEFDFNSTDDNGISGDYLTGLDVAIPNSVTVYQTINSGNWTNSAIWETVPAGGPIPASGPRGSVAIINSGHTVDVIANRDVFSYKTDIYGTLNLNSTTQHRLGYTFGTGTLKMVNMSTLPAGDYSGTNGFITATGGTLEYAGTANYSVLSNIPVLNSVLFSGSGNRDLPNIDLSVYGNVTINGPTVYNAFDQNMEIKGNFTMSSGKYIAKVGGGSPLILLNGSNAQSLSGNFTASNSSPIYNLEINKPALGLTLGSNVEVSNNLALTSGNIITTSANLLTLTNPSSSAITGGSSGSYINGPLRKKIDNLDNFVFPLGKDTRYGQVSALSVQSTVTDNYWTAEYFNSGHSDLSTNPGTYTVTGSEYWKINSPMNGYSAIVKLRWDPLSDINPLTTTGGINDIKVSEYSGTDWIEKSSAVPTGDNSNGYVQTSSAIPINTASDPQYYTLGSSSPVKPTITLGTSPQICSGATTASLPYTATSGSPNQYRIDYDATAEGQLFGDVSWAALPSSPITLTIPAGAVAGTYNGTIQVQVSAPVNTSISYPFTVTLTTAPTVNAVGNQTYCSGEPASLTTLSGPVGGTTFTWTNSNTSIGLAASGSGNPPAFTATNATAAAIAGTITITPTANSCAGTTSSYTITVNPKPAVTDMVSTICSGGAFTATPVNGTDGIVPAGTTYTWLAPVVTDGITGGSAQVTGQASISQTLTNPTSLVQTATYTVVPTSGTCIGNTFTVTVTVTPTVTINAFSPATSTRCQGAGTVTTTTTANNSTGITYSLDAASLAGGNTINAGGAVTYAVNWSGTTTITASAAGCNGPATTMHVVTITPNNTVTLTSAVGTDNQTLCINTAITDITHATTGATGIGAATGLPSGVTAAWAGNTITISGTPTASGVFNYSIPLTGGCGSVNATGSITVTPANTAGAASSTPTLCINTVLTDITHATTGATGIGAATGLPSGVTAAWAGNTITISGTPTASGVFNYSIPLTGGCGSVNATGTITVTPANTAGAASSTPTLCINTVLTDITHATTGATGIGAATGLPSGVTAAWAGNTITISGTPTASGVFNYSIPLTGGCGSVNATGSITVIPANTAGAASSTPTLCINTVLTDITHATTGATGIGAATGLPSGVTAAFAGNTITISGTPTASGVFNYSIPLTGGCGSVNATGTITVNALPSPSIAIAETSGTTNNDGTICNGDPVTLTASGGTSYSWSPATGLSATNIANPVATPSATTTYTVTATDGNGCSNTANGVVTVVPKPSTGDLYRKPNN